MTAKNGKTCRTTVSDMQLLLTQQWRLDAFGMRLRLQRWLQLRSACAQLALPPSAAVDASGLRLRRQQLRSACATPPPTPPPASGAADSTHLRLLLPQTPAAADAFGFSAGGDSGPRGELHTESHRAL